MDLILAFFKLHYFVPFLLGALLVDIFSYLAARAIAQDGGRRATMSFLIRRSLVLFCTLGIMGLSLWIGDVPGTGLAIDGLAASFFAIISWSVIENFRDLGIPIPKKIISTLKTVNEKLGNGQLLIKREETEQIAELAKSIARAALVEARVNVELAHTDDEKRVAKVGLLRAQEDTQSAQDTLVEAEHQVNIHHIDAADILARQGVDTPITAENEPLFVDDDITPDTKPVPVVIVTSVDDVPLPVVVKNENEEGL